MLLRSPRHVPSPRGLLAVALPNFLAYPIRLRLLAGKFEHTAGGVMDETQLHYYTFASGARCCGGTVMP